MPGSRGGGDLLRVLEDGSPGEIRKSIGRWLRVSTALVNAAESTAEQTYPLHALTAAWEGTKVTRVAPVAADAQSVPSGATGKAKVFIWHDRDRSHDKFFDHTPPPPKKTTRPRRTKRTAAKKVSAAAGCC